MMMTEKKNVQCTWQERVIDLLDFLKQEGLSPDLLDGIREFNAQYPTPPELQNRIPQPRYHYYGKDVWEAAVAAILCGENLLLAGSKAKTYWRKTSPRSSPVPHGTCRST